MDLIILWTQMLGQYYERSHNSCIVSLDLLLRPLPPSPRFVVRFVCHFRETENEAHLFCQTRSNKNSEIPWENISFSALFLLLKRAANVRVISPNGLHIPRPTIGRGGAFCALERVWLKFTVFDHICAAHFMCSQRRTNSLTWDKM